MRTAVILANGTPPPRDLLRARANEADLFVCADGGANVAREAGLTPDAIVGDLDSATPATLKHFLGVPIVRDVSQERTDLEKAVAHVLERGPFEQIVILGASSGRLDHVLGHLSLLRRHQPGTSIVLEDAHGVAFLARAEAALDYAAGTVISCFAIGEPAEGVTTEGLRYPLVDRTLAMGAQDSISNVIETRPARIRIGRGELLVMVVREP